MGTRVQPRYDDRNGAMPAAHNPHAACTHLPTDVNCGACKVRAASICAALGDRDISELEDLAQNVRFAEKETILVQGDPARAVFNVTEGTIRLYRLLSDGRRQIVGFLLPGDFLGLSLADHYAFSADAIEPVGLCRFTRAGFVKVVESKPALLRRLYAAATHELTLAQDHMLLLGRRTAEERVAAFLIAFRSRLQHRGASGVTLPLPMTRNDIADYLGLTLETVSRTISKLARDRLILVVPGGVRVLDSPHLEILAAA